MTAPTMTPSPPQMCIRDSFISTLKLDKGLNFKSVITIFQLFLVSFLLKGGINYLVMLFSPIDPTGVTNQVIDMAPNLIVLFIAVAVIPVFFEEILMRGVVLDHFRDTSILQASIVTGLLFGFMHIDLGQFGYSTVLGIIMSAIVLITGSLWGSILFHFLNNGLTVLFVVLMRMTASLVPQGYSDYMINSMEQELSFSAADKVQIVATSMIFLVIGTLLCIRYIKKLIRVNKSEDDNDDTTYRSWKELFVNLPFLIIVLIYIGVNVVF